MQIVLPDTCHLTEFYVFQQNIAPTQRAYKTVDLLTRETADFIPPNLPCFAWLIAWT